MTTFTAAAWTLTIDETTGAYSFTQTAPYQHDSGAATDGGLVTVTITDSDGTPTVVTLSLTIDDDVPVASNDGPVGTSEGALPSTGNVLGNDDLGADHGAAAGVSAIRTGAELDSGTAGTLGTGLAGAWGTLTINADGSYSYTPNASVPDGSVDTFTYTVIDADGDTDTAELTFTFSGDANSPTATSAAAATSDVGGDDGLAGSNGDAFVSQQSSGTLAFDFGNDGAARHDAVCGDL